MGEIVASSSNMKGGLSSIKCPMLSDANYTVCSMWMKVALEVHKVWESIDPGENVGEKNSLAKALLFQSIPETMILQVGNLDTAKEMWEAIKRDMKGLIVSKKRVCKP